MYIFSFILSFVGLFVYKYLIIFYFSMLWIGVSKCVTLEISDACIYFALNLTMNFYPFVWNKILLDKNAFKISLD